MASRRQPDEVVPPRRVKLRKAATPEDLADAGLRRAAGQTMRCEWAQRNPDLTIYHDDFWGEPPSDDREYFERMMLEVFHAGLSWTLIWNKRESLRRAYDAFDIDAVASYGPAEVTRLMNDPNVVRSAKKIDAAIANARTVLALQAEHGDLATFLRQLPDDAEDKIKVLRKTFAFMGPGVARGFLEATGLIPVPHHPYCYKAADAA